MEKKRVFIFLGIVYGLTILSSLPLFLLNIEVKSIYTNFALIIISMIFMWFPTVATLITKKVTKDNFKIKLRPQIKKYWKYYVQACFIPGVLIFIGAILYFVIFPNNFDLTGAYTLSLLPTGTELPFQLSIQTVLLISIALIFVAPLVIINHIFAFGEEYGWRGYILPKLCSIMSVRKSVVVSGILWGLGHAPLICFGLNYNSGYWGYPFTGMLMMIIFATVIGTWLSYLTIKTESVLAASIAHGAINAIREGPFLISVIGVNTLLGPKPSGIIGMSGFIILAIFCLQKIKKLETKNNFSCCIKFLE